MNRTTKHLLAWLALSLCIAGTAQAQLAVRMTMNKKSYLLNEPVTATIHITNHSGRQLVLRGEGRSPWLQFHVTSNGRTVPPARLVNYRSQVIPVGQTIARTVNLSTAYSLGTMGNYTCTATVNLAGVQRNGYVSNRTHCTITSGRPVWMQRAGVPGSTREMREYKLITFTGNRTLNLYAQVNSVNSGRNIVTIPLGKVLTFRKPSATLDRSNNMHVLYQVKPDMYTHCVVSLNGHVVKTGLHKRGRSGNPYLMSFADGSVKVANSVPYDAKAEAEKRKKIRNISERPPFIYRR